MNVVADGLDASPAGRVPAKSFQAMSESRSSRKGLVVRRSGTMMSDAREKCVPSTRISGVG